jgi:hypothetical protein
LVAVVVVYRWKIVKYVSNIHGTEFDILSNPQNAYFNVNYNRVGSVQIPKPALLISTAAVFGWHPFAFSDVDPATAYSPVNWLLHSIMRIYVEPSALESPLRRRSGWDTFAF